MSRWLVLVLGCLAACGSDDGSAAASGAGTYVGLYYSTRRSDIPPSETVTERVEPYTIVVTEAGGVRRFTIDQGCTLTSQANAFSLAPNQSCSLQSMMRNATFTLTAGSFSWPDPDQLSLSLTFRYQRTDNEDGGTFALSYAGGPR